MSEDPITPPCAVCGQPTHGEFYDHPRRHFCNRCGWQMEFARFFAWARSRWQIIRPLLHLRRITRMAVRWENR